MKTINFHNFAYNAVEPRTIRKVGNYALTVAGVSSTGTLLVWFEHKSIGLVQAAIREDKDGWVLGVKTFYTADGRTELQAREAVAKLWDAVSGQTLSRASAAALAEVATAEAEA